MVAHIHDSTGRRKQHDRGIVSGPDYRIRSSPARRPEIGTDAAVGYASGYEHRVGGFA
jgi:hypothetical protein